MDETQDLEVGTKAVAMIAHKIGSEVSRVVAEDPAHEVAAAFAMLAGSFMAVASDPQDLARNISTLSDLMRDAGFKLLEFQAQQHA